jgi:hypothetical protein
VSDSLSSAVRGEPLERAGVDVHARVASGELLVSEVATARQRDVRKEPSESIAPGLCRIADEHDAPALGEPARERSCLSRVALAALGRVDADQAHPLSPSAGADVDGVAVGNEGDRPVQSRRLRLFLLRAARKCCSAERRGNQDRNASHLSAKGRAGGGCPQCRGGVRQPRVPRRASHSIGWPVTRAIASKWRS